jgi:hypothetical protein
VEFFCRSFVYVDPSLGVFSCYSRAGDDSNFLLKLPCRCLQGLVSLMENLLGMRPGLSHMQLRFLRIEQNDHPTHNCRASPLICMMARPWSLVYLRSCDYYREGHINYQIPKGISCRMQRYGVFITMIVLARLHSLCTKYEGCQLELQ